VWHHDVTDREQIVSQRASGVALGLRVHLSGAQQGWLAGLNASYSQGEGDVLTTQPISGTPTVKEELIDVKFSLAQLMGNVGYRWLWDSGLNITWRIGLGLGVHVVETDVEGHFGEHATDEIKRLIGIDGPLATNAELSVGYNF